MKFSTFFNYGLVCALWTAFPFISFGQKMKEVSAEYIYVTTAEQSVAEAKRIALERARLQALADEFGTTVSQTNATHIKNTGNASSLDFLSIGSSEVKGEWIEDTKEPQYDISFADNNLVVKVSVWGKAREVVSAATEVNAALLRNGTEHKFESEEFKEGDDLYLLFKSPVDGYVAVYMVDEANTAWCLLPYSNDTDGQQDVKAGEEYVFFDARRGTTEQEKMLIDEMTVTCDKSVEYSEVYVVFSARPFVKAGDSQTDERLPRNLSSEDFQKWLAKNRVKDNGMVVVKKLLKMTKG